MKQDEINPTHYHIFVGKLEIGSIHGPTLNNDFIVYNINDYKQYVYKTFDECINHIEGYLHA